MTNIGVAKSFIREEELAQLIEQAYGLRIVRCQLITATMRDVYLVLSHRGRHILMVYRHGQHTADEIIAEWQFITYLAENDIPVASVVPQNRGDFLLTIDAPEGIRYGVLSQYVEGEHLRRRPSVQAVQAYGQTIAQIHKVADKIPFTLKRPENNIHTILQSAVAAFEAEVFDRPGDLGYLHKCHVALSQAVDEMVPEQPVYGLIHGDVIRANALVSNNGQVTVIDFDLCGLGWRAYDIASYLHTIRNTSEEREFEEAFLTGYSLERSLNASEQAMIPIFEAVRAIFSIGVPAMNIYHWGRAFFDAFVDHSLDRLRSSMAQIV